MADPAAQLQGASGVSGEPPAPAVTDQDTAMADAPSTSTPTTSTPTHVRVSTPVGGRTSTPQRNVAPPANSAASAPNKAILNGSKSRQYLNDKVTLVLLEGVKKIASEQPEAPLKVLGEFLLAKSRELEGN